MPDAIPCDPAAIAKASACFCLPEPAARAALLYLLNSMTGLNLTPAQLADNSKCFCMNEQAARGAMIYLLCEMLKGGSSSGTCIICLAEDLTPIEPATCDCSIAYNMLGQFWFWNSLTTTWFPISL